MFAKRYLLGPLFLLLGYVILAKTAVLPFTAIEYLGGYWKYDSIWDDLAVFGGFILLIMGIVLLMVKR